MAQWWAVHSSRKAFEVEKKETWKTRKASYKELIAHFANKWLRWGGLASLHIPPMVGSGLRWCFCNSTYRRRDFEGIFWVAQVLFWKFAVFLLTLIFTLLSHIKKLFSPHENRIEKCCEFCNFIAHLLNSVVCKIICYLTCEFVGFLMTFKVHYKWQMRLNLSQVCFTFGFWLFFYAHLGLVSSKCLEAA